MRRRLQRLIDPTRVAESLDMLSERKKDLLCVILLAIIPVTFFANVLFTDQVLVGDNLGTYLPWGAYESEELLQRPSNRTLDPLLSYYPRTLIAVGIVRAGSLPLWDPYKLGGVPLLATAPGAGFFYPPSIIYYVVSPLRGFGVSACLHLFLAGMFMYFYLRSIQLDRISSMFGAISFQLSGYFLVNLMWLVRVSVAAWAPLLFFSFEKYLREKRWGYAILLAFGVGMCILAGGFAVFAFIMLGLGLYCGLRFAVTISKRGAREAMKSMAVVVAAIGLGVLLGAIQLIPFYQASSFSERAYWSYEDLPDTGRSPLSLATALVPDIFGNPVDSMWATWGKRPGHYFGRDVPGNYAQPNIFAGVLPLLLGLWALAFRRNIYSLFFGAWAILSLSLFLTLPSLLYRMLFVTPVFRAGRSAEAKVGYAFALCVLAAWGFSSLVRETKYQSRSRMRKASEILLATGMAALVGVIGMAFVSGPIDAADEARGWYLYNIPNFARMAALLLASALVLRLRVRERIGANLYSSFGIALVVVDLFYFGWKFNPPQRREELLFETDSIRFLRADGELLRIMRGTGGNRVLPPNTPSIYGISDAQGYTSLMLNYYQDFLQLIEPSTPQLLRNVPSLRRVASFSSKLLDLLNVKYILTSTEASEELARFDRLHEDIDLVYEGEISIYENKDVLPRAFVVHEFKVLSDREDILAELTSEQFDPRSYVILEEEPPRTTTAVHPSGVDSTVRILDYTPSKVVIQVGAAGDAFLVLSDLYYEGWKVFVDGRNQKVYRADYVFRAVQLSGGQHTVEFVFDPLSFKIGLSISAVALTTMCTLFVFDLVPAHRPWGP